MKIYTWQSDRHTNKPTHENPATLHSQPTTTTTTCTLESPGALKDLPPKDRHQLGLLILPRASSSSRKGSPPFQQQGLPPFLRVLQGRGILARWIFARLLSQDAPPKRDVTFIYIHWFQESIYSHVSFIHWNRGAEVKDDLAFVDGMFRRVCRISMSTNGTCFKSSADTFPDHFNPEMATVIILFRSTNLANLMFEQHHLHSQPPSAARPS